MVALAFVTRYAWVCAMHGRHFAHVCCMPAQPMSGATLLSGRAAAQERCHCIVRCLSLCAVCAECQPVTRWRCLGHSHIVVRGDVEHHERQRL